GESSIASWRTRRYFRSRQSPLTRVGGESDKSWAYRARRGLPARRREMAAVAGRPIGSLDVSSKMVTVAQARKIALSMPQAEELKHHGHPDFRVNGKIFATLWPDQSTAVVKLPLADQAALIQMDPDAFSLNAWSHQGATTVH